MDVIGQYYAPHIKSKKERITSKDKVETFDRAAWDDYDIRVRRLFALEKRLADLRHEDDDAQDHTPVYKARNIHISNWLGAVAAEQDQSAGAPDKAIKAYTSSKAGTN